MQRLEQGNKKSYLKTNCIVDSFFETSTYFVKEYRITGNAKVAEMKYEKLKNRRSIKKIKKNNKWREKKKKESFYIFLWQ